MANYADPVINSGLEAIEATIGTSPTFKVLSGAMPATASAADAGTTLASGSLVSDWSSAASGATKALATSFADASVDAAGVARYLRVYRASDSVCMSQALLSEARVGPATYVAGQQYHNASAVYVVTTGGTTASGTGPTATTGTGISDGTCVVSFLKLLPDLVVSPSTVLTLGQSFTVNSMTFDATSWR